MRSVKEMTEAQRFLERYANTPLSTIDREQARIRLQRLGVLTSDNRISEQYSEIIVSTQRGRVSAKLHPAGKLSHRYGKK